MIAGRSNFAVRRGFTLMEVLTILVIGAFLAAVAVPRYGNALNNFAADAAARRIAADLALAQAMARNSSSSQTVSFNASTKQYQIVGYPDPDSPGNTYTVSLAADPYRATLAAVSLTKAGTGVGQVTFDKYGFPDASGVVQVTVGSVSKRVTLDATTGRTSIE
jgi:prepilin-type N-terminal cleavage/methylation domain-containing protein